MPATLMSDTSMTYSNRIEPWHQLGVKMPEGTDGMLALAALEHAKLDYELAKARPFYVVPATGDIRESEATWIILRGPAPQHGFTTWDEIGRTGDRHELLQNREIAEILDGSGVTKEWPVETMGALGVGDKFFVTLRAGRFAVAGEEHISYVSVLDDKGGNAALKIVESQICVVCQNTYNMAEASAQMTASIPHTSKIRADFQWKVGLFRQVQESQRTFADIAATFAKSRVNEELMKSVMESVFPLPKPPKADEVEIKPEVDHVDELTRLVHKELIGEQIKVVGTVGDVERRYVRAKTRVLARREAVEREYALTCQERPKIAGTAWALFNAFTGAVDHGMAPGHSRDARVRAESAVLGREADLKATAFSAILSQISSN